MNDLTFQEKFYIAAFIEQFKDLEINNNDELKSIKRINVLMNKKQLDALKKFNSIVDKEINKLKI